MSLSGALVLTPNKLGLHGFDTINCPRRLSNFPRLKQRQASLSTLICLWSDIRGLLSDHLIIWTMIDPGFGVSEAPKDQ